MTARDGPVGMFDSGAGGLSVLGALRALAPAEDVAYFADTRFFPYGPRPEAEVRDRCRAISRELLALGAKAIVVACNRATSAGIASLRDEFPEVPFIGMEPALKPAAATTVAGRVAVLTTPGTARGEKLAALIDRYGAEVRVDTIEAPSLAELVEAGDLGSAAVRSAVRGYVAQARSRGADVLALGCTHYAFLLPLFEQEAGEGLAVIEPSDAVARQVVRVLDERGLSRPAGHRGSVRYLCSGDTQAFARTRDALMAAAVGATE